jgi:hypothetical protein
MSRSFKSISLYELGDAPIFEREVQFSTCTNISWLLLLNLVDEAKLELGLYAPLHSIIAVTAKAKEEGDEVAITRFVAVRKVRDAHLPLLCRRR